MTISLRSVRLDRLNALTKYPSIQTYHPLHPPKSRSHGRRAPVLPQVRFSGQVLATEKIDGANARIILLPDGSFLLGSREELLYAAGDLLWNPALGIVATVRPVAERLCPLLADSQAVVVFY